MPKKKKKTKKKENIIKKRKKTSRKKSEKKIEKEIIYKTKKEWINKAIVNKSQYEKKYKVSISDNDVRHVLGGQSIEVTLFSGSYDFSADCSSNAYQNDQLTLIEQIACDLNADWSTSVELVCGDEHTFTIN